MDVLGKEVERLFLRIVLFYLCIDNSRHRVLSILIVDGFIALSSTVADAQGRYGLFIYVRC